MATIDLSQLPAPDVVETLDYEVLLAERKATLISLYPEEQQAAVALTLALESEPIVKVLQENAYREVILRQRINEAARAVMVAYAIDDDLDQVGANNGVTRLTITPADDSTIPPVAAVMESNDDFRARIAGAFEGLSVAGPSGAYEYHARSADGRVSDASATSPSPAVVVVTVLAREGDGTAPADLLAVVDAKLNDENIRPIADRVIVQSAEIIPYEIEAELYLYPGPEAEPVLAASQAKLAAFVSAQKRLGRDICLSALYAAMHVEGVQRVNLIKPAADYVLDKTQAAFCTSSMLSIGGSDE